jgi:uncharacterized membrane protein (UPF0127 family)
MKKLTRVLIVVFSLIIIAGFLACLFFLLRWPGAKDVYFSNQPNFVIHAELAQIPTQWQKGLMFRKSIPADSGMLFIFPAEATQSFWMKNTLIPLDIIFISADNKIVDIKNNFQPCAADPCPVYQSAAPVKYVLEVNAGVVREKGISVGDAMVIR